MGHESGPEVSDLPAAPSLEWDLEPKPEPVVLDRSKALRGSAWTLIGYGGSIVLRMGSSLVLTRLLFPRAFGISALLALFMQGLSMFSDMGFAQSIVRDPQGDEPAFLHTAWSIQAVRGVVLWLGSCLIAGPMAYFYNTPELAWLFPITGLTAIFEGLNSTAWHTNTRHLRLAPTTTLNLIHQATSLIITTALALALRSVWALVLGGLISAFIKCILSHLMLGGKRHRFRWDRASARRQLHFGKWIFLGSVAAFLSMQADRLLVGKLASIEELGVYSLAVMLAMMPRDVVVRLGNTVLLPIASRAVHSEGPGSPRVRKARLSLLGVAALMCVGLWAGATPLIGLLYDSRYAGAKALVAVLVAGTWIQSLTVSSYMILLAAGRPIYQSWGSCLRLGLIVVFVSTAYRHFGVLGIAGLTAIGDLALMTNNAWGTYRLGASMIRIDLLLTAAVVSSAVALGFLSERVVATTGSKLAGLALIATVTLSGLLILATRARRGGRAPAPLAAG